MSATPAEYVAFKQFGGIADLSGRAKIRLTGADRARFLNGQVTANISRLQPGQTAPACVTSAKGKLNAVVFVTALDDSLLIDAEPEQRETLPARLERYVIADDVLIEDVTDELALLHVIGIEPAALELGSDASVAQANRFGQAGADIFLSRASFDVQRSRLAERHAFLDPELLEVLRIESGIPKWGAELTEDTLPPEAGLDRTHIDYHKGCYIGQEVISRIRSVGHVNRSLFGFISTALTEDLLAPGMRLFAPDNEEKQIGVLTSAVWSFALSKPIALGYLKRGSPTGDLIARPAHSDAPTLHVLAQELPFTS